MHICIQPENNINTYTCIKRICKNVYKNPDVYNNKLSKDQRTAAEEGRRLGSERWRATAGRATTLFGSE